MKHGDKAKGKAGKASGKKSGKAAAAKGESSRVIKGKKHETVAATKAGSKNSKAIAKSEDPGNGTKARARAGSDEVGFSNPVVAAAFKRAVKKYPNAFRRLTD
jgi:hypothetical protein